MQFVDCKRKGFYIPLASKDAASKVMAATAASTKAEADNTEMQDKYAKQIADLKADDETGKEDAKAHREETAAGIKANNDAIAPDNAKTEAASKAKANAEAAHKTTLDGISSKYNANSKAIKHKLAADSKTLSNEKAAPDAKFAAEFKYTAAKAATAKAAGHHGQGMPDQVHQAQAPQQQR